MGINQDGLLSIKAQLASRIDAISDQLGHSKSGSLVRDIDEIRRVARDHGMDALADLAFGLERVLARAGGSMAIQPLLESMRDAIGVDTADAKFAEAHLAMVNLRLYG